MHHVTLDRWSRGESFLHRRDARAKALVTLATLIAIGTAGPPFWRFGAPLLALLALAAAASGLPLRGVLARALAVLPFSAAFGLISWLAGDPARAALLVAKSYFSAVAVLLLAGTTPVPALLDGLGRLGAPRFLLLVAQFLYRYLFVLSEEAQHMRAAAVARGTATARRARQAAAGAVAVLFLRSYERAEAIHRAMAARGFDGRLRPLRSPHFGAADALFVVASTAGIAVLRAVAEGVR